MHFQEEIAEIDEKLQGGIIAGIEEIVNDALLGDGEDEGNGSANSDGNGASYLFGSSFVVVIPVISCIFRYSQAFS